MRSLPQDGHVHSEWSWDAPGGAMAETCARAVRVGLDSVVFTEHADFTPWFVPAEAVPRLPGFLRERLGADGVVRAPAFDVNGYLDRVRKCRELFPGLRILTGVELGEPHLHPAETAALLGGDRFDRVVGAVHAVRDGTWWREVGTVDAPAAEIVRGYLAEVLELVDSAVPFEVLAHVDYPFRYYRENPADFEEEFRVVLRALARSGRVLEINSRVPLSEHVVRWWRGVGGRAVAFGSDAHEPTEVGRGFAHAAAIAQAHGFQPGPDFWTR
ncbi:PHP domain-containing protein [Actinosynnema sp. NPDC020468]|uniref:PHP domain-containing protein n=1 Tax=Actinosynnema sp. NPDC020468 TaxID=3154488 RepID=UPI003401DCC9